MREGVPAEREEDSVKAGTLRLIAGAAAGWVAVLAHAVRTGPGQGRRGWVVFCCSAGLGVGLRLTEGSEQTGGSLTRCCLTAAVSDLGSGLGTAQHLKALSLGGRKALSTRDVRLETLLPVCCAEVCAWVPQQSSACCRADSAEQVPVWQGLPSG